MNTRLIILLSGVVVIGVGVVAYFFLSGGQQPAVEKVQTGVGLPVAGQTTSQVITTGAGVPSTQEISLVAVGGGVITAENFLKNPNTIADPVNSGYYDFGSTTSTPPFMVTYIAPTQYFNIELLQEPIGQTRELAQQYLEQYLGISTSDLCKLNYTVSTPSEVSKLYGGVDLRFGSCPDATVLPK